MSFLLQTFVAPPFAENAYLLGDTESGEAVVVDPGGPAGEIVLAAERAGVRIRDIVNTHSHIDHIAGVDELRTLTGARFHLHPAARPMLDAAPQQAAMFGLPPISVPTVDAELAEGQRIVVGGIELVVRSTPGHAPGHVTLVGPSVELEGLTASFALVGDVIFREGIGRVDLPGGDMATLMRSIETEIMTLDDSTRLFSGHGPPTTVGHERGHNPFLAQWRAYRSRSPSA